ncbi:MAG TPA: hypothetical protein VNA31_06300 [bacterium]|nr:hypothetical protein [bacterium]
MRYPVHLEGFEGQTLEIQPGGLFSGPKIFVNHQLAPKGKGREVILHRNDGRSVVATLKPRALGLDVPQLVIEGKTISVTDPLKWYVWMWIAWPLLLLFVGGALGGMTGALGFATNMTIVRSKITGLAKFALTTAVSAFVVAAFLAAVVALGGYVK